MITVRSLATGDSSESECKETKTNECLKYHVQTFSQVNTRNNKTKTKLSYTQK